MLSLNPLVPRLVARRATNWDAIRRLLEGTGSYIEPRGIELYARLFQRHGHVAATLGMMARWDLDWLDRRLGQLAAPLVLVTAAGDRAIRPADAAAFARRVPSARVVSLPEGGHLVHEERPSVIADLILRLAAEAAMEALGDEAHVAARIVAKIAKTDQTDACKVQLANALLPDQQRSGSACGLAR